MIVFGAFVNNVNTCNNLKSIQIDFEILLKTFLKHCFGNDGENVDKFKAIKFFVYGRLIIQETLFSS